MKCRPASHVSIGLLFLFTAVMFGCGGPGGSNGDGAQGASSIRGNISSFETADAGFTPVTNEKETFLAQVVSCISELIMPSAYAAGNREGIIVYLDGPVSRSTTTAADGSFSFSQLPAGTYSLRFEYNGEEVMYRGRSGQTPEITLGENELIELVDLRISGGKVNVGNIHVLPLGGSD
jgi:hypothetical protein